MPKLKDDTEFNKMFYKMGEASKIIGVAPSLLRFWERYVWRRGAKNALQISTAVASNVELMMFGALIIFFLIVEPHGLARLWQIGKEKLRLWPFPH